jgi:hypothetical protein
MLTVFGLGFPPFVLYECLFSTTTYPDSVRHPILVNASWTSESSIQCRVPEWPYPAGRAQVLVRKRDYGPQSLMEDSTFVFHYAEIALESHLPSLAFSSVSVNFTGKGFDPNGTYTLMLTANQSASVYHAGPGQTVVKSFLSNWVTDSADSVSNIVFPLVTWPHYSGEVEVRLLRDGNLVAGNASKAAIVFAEWWNQVEPRAVSAIGAVITIIGEGFAGSASDYACQFAQTNSRGNVTITINATNASLNSIICPLEPGFGNMQAGFMRVALLKKSRYIYGPPITYGYDSGPPLSVSWLDAAIGISEVITGSTPAFGSAFGNESFFFFGFGFLVPAGGGRQIDSLSETKCVIWTCDRACKDECTKRCITVPQGFLQECISNCTGGRMVNEKGPEPYSATFGGVLAPCCEVVNETLIACTSPEWWFEAAMVDVLLWHRLPTPRVSLISAYEPLIETPLDNRSCAVTDPLIRCTIPSDCDKYHGTPESTCLKNSDDSMFGVCMPEGTCFTHEHCPGNTMCSELCKCVLAKVCLSSNASLAPAYLVCILYYDIYKLIKHRLSATTTQDWCSSDGRSTLMDGQAQGITLSVSKNFQCKKGGLLSPCDNSALIDGITSFESAYHAPHTDVDSCDGTSQISFASTRCAQNECPAEFRVNLFAFIIFSFAGSGVKTFRL